MSDGQVETRFSLTGGYYTDSLSSNFQVIVNRQAVKAIQKVTQ